MMKILAHVMVAASLSVLFGCASQTKVLRDKALTSGPTAEFLPYHDRYCLPGRAGILSVDVKMAQGWPTAPGHDVRLSNVHEGAAPNCKVPNPPLIADGDLLSIHDNAAGDRILGFTHGGQTQSLNLLPTPGLAAGQPNLWYQTSPDPQNKYQYFVYMLDDHTGALGKEQWYMLEVFDLSETTACLDERPTITMVTPDPDYKCKFGGFNENGTGSGYEPK